MEECDAGDRTAEDALRLKETAKHKRLTAKYLSKMGDALGARWERREADEADRRAEEILSLSTKPEVGTGGELSLSEKVKAGQPGLALIVSDPDIVNVEASWDRLNLAADAQCLAMATDAAEAIGAENSLERMLAHQIAAAHTMAMKLLEKSHQFLGHVSSWNGECRQQVSSIEAARLASSAARMMDAYQKGLATLQRLRSGGNQTITVQHVRVAEGGQAVVAGTIKAESRGRKGGTNEN